MRDSFEIPLRSSLELLAAYLSRSLWAELFLYGCILGCYETSRTRFCARFSRSYALFLRLPYSSLVFGGSLWGPQETKKVAGNPVRPFYFIKSLYSAILKGFITTLRSNPVPALSVLISGYSWSTVCTMRRSYAVIGFISMSFLK